MGKGLVKATRQVRAEALSSGPQESGGSVLASSSSSQGSHLDLPSLGNLDAKFQACPSPALSPGWVSQVLSPSIGQAACSLWMN